MVEVFGHSSAAECYPSSPAKVREATSIAQHLLHSHFEAPFILLLCPKPAFTVPVVLCDYLERIALRSCQLLRQAHVRLLREPLRSPTAPDVYHLDIALTAALNHQAAFQFAQNVQRHRLTMRIMNPLIHRCWRMAPCRALKGLLRRRRSDTSKAPQPLPTTGSPTLSRAVSDQITAYTRGIGRNWRSAVLQVGMARSLTRWLRYISRRHVAVDSEIDLDIQVRRSCGRIAALTS